MIHTRVYYSATVASSRIMDVDTKVYHLVPGTRYLVPGSGTRYYGTTTLGRQKTDLDAKEIRCDVANSNQYQSSRQF